MPKVSRRSLSPLAEKKLVRNLWWAMKKLDERERVYLLDRILTPTEKVMLAKRLAVLEELRKGSTYVKIAKKFRVISTTISRMSSVLQSSPKLPAILGKVNQSPATKRSVRKRGRQKRPSVPSKIWFT